MPQVVHHILKLFADDSELMGLIRNLFELHTMQSDLDALTKWAEDWRMVFHPDKCKLMVIDKHKHVTQKASTITMKSKDAARHPPHLSCHKYRKGPGSAYITQPELL